MWKFTLKSCMILCILSGACVPAAAQPAMEAGPKEAASASPPADDLAQRVEIARQRVKMHPGQVNDLVELGRALYLAGVQQNDGLLLEESRALWKQLLEEYPGDPLILVYAGSLRVLQARDTPLFWDKAKLLRQGQAMIEQALTAAPRDMEILWLASVTAWNLPAMFGVRDKAVGGFTRLSRELVKMELMDAGLACPKCDRIEDAHDPMVDTLEPAMKASVWQHYGLLLWQQDKASDARGAWHSAITAAPGSTAAQASAALLAQHGLPAAEGPHPDK